MTTRLWVLLSLLAAPANEATEGHPSEAPLTQCVRDEECFLATTCSGCNRCFSRPVVGPGESDCKATCKSEAAQRTCRCRFGLCEVAPVAALGLDVSPPERRQRQLYLGTAPGKKCQVQTAFESIGRSLKRSLEKSGVDVGKVWVTSSLAAGTLPAACVERTTAEFWAAHPRAASGFELKQPRGCTGCECMETWYYCLESSAEPGVMRNFGFAPVRM